MTDTAIEPTTALTTRAVSVTVNGESHAAEVEPRLLLVHFLRQTLGLTGTHQGCDTTHCGACTVLLDGVPVKSCTVLAFREEHGLQCGFCTPGMMLTSVALLQENPDPTDEEIRWALSGNICRCTGYQNIVKAVHHAANAQANEGGS